MEEFDHSRRQGIGTLLEVVSDRLPGDFLEIEPIRPATKTRTLRSTRPYLTIVRKHNILNEKTIDKLTTVDSRQNEIQKMEILTYFFCKRYENGIPFYRESTVTRLRRRKGRNRTSLILLFRVGLFQSTFCFYCLNIGFRALSACERHRTRSIQVYIQ